MDYLKDLGTRTEQAVFCGALLFYFGYMTWSLWLALTDRI